jgi:hypothetical protein
MSPDIQSLSQGAGLSFDFTTIFIGLAFSLVGLCAWRYGRQNNSGRHMMLGVGLMAYTYFVPNFWWAIFIGVVMTVFLFWP